MNSHVKQDTLGIYFMKRLKQREAITEEAKEFISQLAPLFMDGAFLMYVVDSKSTFLLKPSPLLEVASQQATLPRLCSECQSLVRYTY